MKNALLLPSGQQYESLGRFISAFSNLEVVIHIVLRAAIGIDDRVGRALIGQPQISQVMTTFKLAVSQLDPPEAHMEHLTFLTNEVSFINSVRRVAAHKPFYRSAGGDYLFHDRFTTKNLRSVLQYVCSERQIRGCTAWTSEMQSLALTLTDVSGNKLWDELPSRDKFELPDNPGSQSHRVDLIQPPPPQSSPA